MRGQDPNGHRAGFTLIELLVVIAIIAVLIGLLIPAVQKVREAAQRAQCQNNLKQLALAAINYHDANQTFPLAYNYFITQPKGGYVTQYIALLPYLEQQALYQQLYNQAIANNTYMGNNKYATSADGLCSTPLSVLACPADQLPNPPTTHEPSANIYGGLTSYLGNTSGGGYPNGMTKAAQGVFPIDGNPPVKILAITDGSSNTIMFGERYNYDPNWNAYLAAFGFPAPYPTYYGWFSYALTDYANFYPLGSGFYPLNLRLPALSSSGPNFLDLFNRSFAYGSGHTGGANFAFCDGSVHFLNNSINNTPTVLPALSTISGGEVIPAAF